MVDQNNNDPLAGDQFLVEGGGDGTAVDMQPGDLDGGDAFDPLAGAGETVEEWAPDDDRYSTGNTADLLADFNPSDLMPATDIGAWVTDDKWYPAWLSVAGMKIQSMPVHKKSGLMCPIHAVFYEWVARIELDGLNLPPDVRDTVDPAVEGIWILPIRVAPGSAFATPDEHSQFQAAISRGQDNIGPFYDYVGMPLQPDSLARNRLAPLGRFAPKPGEQDAKGRKLRPGLHPNWRSLYDFRLEAHAPEGFPVLVKRSGGFWNCKVIDKQQIAATLSRRAELARMQRLAAENTVGGGGQNTDAGDGFVETPVGG